MARTLTYDAKTIQLIRAMAKRGVRVPEIAKKIGRKYSGVWQLMVRLGIPRQSHWKFPLGDKNPSWTGGRWIDSDGYVLVRCPDHPYQSYGGYVREHRLVMENKLGRYLHPREVVHHIDKNKQNNHIDNLKLYCSNGDHLRDELTGNVPKWSEDGKRRILEGTKRRARNQRKGKKQKTNQTR